jgi:hypothetical protein
LQDWTTCKKAILNKAISQASLASLASKASIIRGDTKTDGQTQTDIEKILRRSHKPTFIFENKESRLKINLEGKPVFD